MGRRVSTTSPDTGTITYIYNEAGNPAEKTDANGITVSYTYDLLNRLTAIHFPDSTQDITYTYDTGANGKGLLGAMTDPSGSMAFGYDNRSRLAEKTSTIGSHSFNLTYAYTPGDRLGTVTYPTGRTVDYTRNSRGHIEGATTTHNAVTTTLASNIIYGPFGPGRGMATGSGGEVSNTHDESGRMTVANPGEEKERTFTYDANGNLTSIQATNNPHYNQEFTYDDLNRLISATGRYGTISYTYDNLGNRLTRIVNDDTETYNYLTGTNRLQEITGQNPLTFTYDANGNTTGMGDKTLAYNQNNRLIQADQGESTLGDYTYNGRGQRVKKSADGQTILFIYDKAGKLISEADDKGNILREYVYLGANRLCQFVYEIPEQIEVSVTTSKGRNLTGINVYAFTESGSYTGLNAVTDDQGVASFETDQFSDGNYKFRADYVSYQFWSSVITVPGTYSAEVVIEEETAEITVTVAGEAKEGVTVYVFNEDGTYLGIYG
ncbi:MAG: RHS repeat protein, partial [Deltaproteobacteria bacterium]|nr:RHS repeat protein [Deltaproteobacteria bacterium]